jgi:beta-glucosidase
VADQGPSTGDFLGTPEAVGTSDPDLELLQRLRHDGIPVVAVFLTGRTRGIAPELQTSDAFVVAWLPGSEGAGIADVLFRNDKGAVSFDFTGRLSYSWPAGGARNGELHRSGKPASLFPYGFGLSYCNRHCDAPLSREPWLTQQSSTSRNMRASP